MRYISTRGQAEQKDFSGVLLAGLGSDGGLYMPESWPRFSAAELRALRGLPYAELAAKVIAPFVGDCIEFADLQAMCRRAYAGFAHPATVPLVQLDSAIFALELFHGPTLAFKDLALQLAGHLFDHVLAQRERARVHRRRDFGRYRLGGDRGDGRDGTRRHHHSPPRGPHQARCSAGR